MIEKKKRCPSCGRYRPESEMQKKAVKGSFSNWRWRCMDCAERVKARHQQQQEEVENVCV